MQEDTQVQTNESTPQEPIIPLSEGVTVSNDVADDAFLDNIMGGSEPEESNETSSDSQQHQSEDSEVTSSHEVADAAEVESQSSEDDSGNTTELESDDYAKAIAALQRDGVPRSVIDQMADENPQSIVDWGLKRAKVQSDVDSYGAKVKDLEEKLASNNETLGNEEEAVGADQPTSQPTESAEMMNRYESEISEVFGDEAAKSVMSPIRDLVSETSQVLAQQHEMMQQMYSVMERQAIDQSRGRLGERFSRLNDDDAFNEVVEQMGKLAQVGEYKDLDALMTDAYRLKFAAVAEQDAVQQQQRSLREAGQPTATTQTSRPAMSKTVQDREDDVLDALLSGKGFDGASAAYNG
jgi:hypothetical protein